MSLLYSAPKETGTLDVSQYRQRLAVKIKRIRVWGHHERRRECGDRGRRSPADVGRPWRDPAPDLAVRRSRRLDGVVRPRGSGDLPHGGGPLPQPGAGSSERLWGTYSFDEW